MIATNNAASETGPRVVLNVGAGTQIDESWERQGYRVVRLDIDPSTNPDIVADMCNMGEVGEFDVVVCCHALEHLFPHQVGMALREFRRVLKPKGTVIIFVPDLEDVRPDSKPLPIPTSKPLCGLHLFYGDPGEIEQHPYMAHHCGFIRETLADALSEAGFSAVNVNRISYYNLMGTATK